MSSNKQYTSVIQRHSVVQENDQFYNTICVYPNCHSNCCEVCLHTAYTDDIDLLRRKCIIFGNNDSSGDDDFFASLFCPQYCNNCHHSPEYHQHQYSRWVSRRWSETVVDQGMKSSYDDAKQSVDSYDSQARDQRSLISSTESSVAACQITLRDQCRNFEKLAF